MISCQKADVGATVFSAIDDICLQVPAVDSVNRKVARLVLKGLALGIPTVGRCFFIPVAYDFGSYVSSSKGEANAIGALCAGGNIIAFVTLGYWSVSGLIDETLGPRGARHNDLSQSFSKTREVTVISLAAVGACVAHLPIAFMGARYNRGAMKPVAFITLMVASSLFPLRSFQLSFNAMIDGYGSDERKRKIEKIRNDVASLILKNREVFHGLSIEKKISFIEEASNIRLIPKQHDRIRAYLAHMLTENLTTPVRTSSKILKIAGQTFGAMSSLFFTYALSDYSFHASKEQISDNDALASTVAFLTGAGWIYLSAKSFMNAYGRAFVSFGNMVTSGRVVSMSEQLRPKLTFALKATTLLIDILGAGPTFYVWHDMPGVSEGKQKVYESVVPPVLSVLLLIALFDTVDSIVMLSIKCRSTDEEEAFLNMSNEFSRLSRQIQTLSADQFSSFLGEASIYQEVCERLNIEQKRVEELLGLANSHF